MLSSIGSAVFKFIGHKQTNRHPNSQAKYIYRYICVTDQVGRTEYPKPPNLPPGRRGDRGGK